MKKKGKNLHPLTDKTEINEGKHVSSKAKQDSLGDNHDGDYTSLALLSYLRCDGEKKKITI